MYSRNLFWRALILFVNFFFILLAYYHIKPASRSLFIEHLGASNLPYVWICTAVILGLLIGYYQRLIKRWSRFNIVISTLFLFMIMLIGFRFLLEAESWWTSVAFYIFVDIFSVVLVEQFWSLTNSIYRYSDGKRWYGVVGTGGLLGGVFGGKLAQQWLESTSFGTADLLIVAAGILLILVLINLFFARVGIYQENTEKQAVPSLSEGWSSLVKNRYLMLIAVTLMLAQIAAPIVEFKFMDMVEHQYSDLNERTSFLSGFFAMLGMISIGVNLFLTPLIHRQLGVVAGLTVQPLLLMISTWHFYLTPSMLSAQMMKVCDRAMSYSINRASRELLYVPIDTVKIYQAKAWIDMFGYRLFKVVGSLLILLLTQWINPAISTVGLSWLTMLVCLIWLFAIFQLAREHRLVIQTLPA